jgi:hypothetical protein
MTNVRSFKMCCFVTLLILGIYGIALAQDKDGTIGIQSTSCHTTLTSGSGANYLQVCITNHGNLINFISPNGSGDHINSEGYALCDNTGGEFVDGYDTGSSEAGCGNPTISQPNGANTLPLTITRTCDCIRFKQVFSRDTTEKDITITMTLTNVCSFTLNVVRVSRYFDGDLNGDSGDDTYDKSFDAVWARDDFGQALTLTALTFGTSHEARIEEYRHWNPNGEVGFQSAKGCSALAGGQIGPTSPGDFVGRATYFLGNLSPNQSKTVKVVYRRQ